MSKYTPEIIEEICGYIESGLNQKDAQILADISHQTFHRWLEEHSEFSEAIKKAKVKNKAHHINKISNDKSWQASAWYLERIYKDEYQIKKEEVKQPITIVWPEDKIPKKVG
jgi:hypothetical protein